MQHNKCRFVARRHGSLGRRQTTSLRSLLFALGKLSQPPSFGVIQHQRNHGPRSWSHESRTTPHSIKMVRYALSATSQILISARARKNGAEGGGRHAFFACFARCNCCPRHQTRRTNAPQPRGSASSQTLHTTHARGTHGGRTGGRRRDGRGGRTGPGSF